MSQLFSSLFATLGRRRLARAHERRGSDLYQSGEFEAAAMEYRAALGLDPDRALTHFNLGLALYKGNQKTEARRAWEEALALAEGRNAYLEEQARIMLRQFG